MAMHRRKTNKTYKGLDQVKKILPEVLKKYLGNVSKTIDELGIARITYYEWYNSDEQFRARCDEVNERILDFSESMLFRKIDEGDTNAIKYHLNCKGRARGYGNVSQVEIGNKDEQPFEVRHNLTKEQIDAIVKGTKELRSGNDE